MARQIGKMLHAREPKITSDPGETYVWVFAYLCILKMQCACEHTVPRTNNTDSCIIGSIFETSASDVVLSMQLLVPFHTTVQCVYYLYMWDCFHEKGMFFSRFQFCDIQEF